jgi:hypothetical protein
LTKPSTDLIDRYLQAVGFWLPRAQKQDILAELSEDLRSQIEDRETGLGRSLTESEVAEFLKQRGRPVLVASQFLPQRSLISPALYPIYILCAQDRRALLRGSMAAGVVRHPAFPSRQGG